MKNNLRPSELLFLLAVITASFLFNALHSMAISNILVDDEYAYLIQSGSRQLIELFTTRVNAAIPSPLFFAVGSIASSYGQDAGAVMRLINSLAYATACIPIYLTAKILLQSASVRYLTTALVCFYPITSYVPMFMPETLYFLVFSFFILAFVWFAEDGSFSTYRALPCFILSGMLYCIKPHGVFVVVALTCALVWIGILQRRQGPRLVAVLAWGILAFLVTALVISNAFGTTTLFGGQNLYLIVISSSAGKVTADPSALIHTGKQWGAILAGLLLVVVAAYGPASISAVSSIFSTAKISQSPGDTGLYLTVLIGIMFVELLLVDSFFSTSWAPAQGIRLHARYLNFLGPTLVLLWLMQLEHSRSLSMKLSTVLFALLVPTFLFAGPLLFPSLEWGFYSDSPESSVVRLNIWIKIALSAIAILAVLLSLGASTFRRYAPLLFLFPYFCLNIIHNQYLQKIVTSNDTSRTQAQLISSLIDRGDFDKGMIVAPARRWIWGIAFHLNDVPLPNRQPREQTFDCATLQKPVKWIYFIGPYQRTGCDAPRAIEAAHGTLLIY